MQSAPASNGSPDPLPTRAADDAVSGSRLLLARLVHGHHLVSTILISIGWALPWTWTLWTVLVVYPLVQIQWWLFGNRCVLSILEEKLRRTGPAAGEAEELHFVQVLGSRLLRRPLSRVWADVFSYGVLWGGFAVAAARLYLRA